MKVCPNCFEDFELKQFIKVNSTEKGVCDYCTNVDSELLEVGELLDFFSEFIGIFKSDPNGVALIDLIQSDWNLFSGNTHSKNILSEILLGLDSAINPQSTVYYIDEIVECYSYWEILKEEIKWKKRFLTNIDVLEELGWIKFFNQTMEWQKSKFLYRARLHFSGNQKEFKIEDMGFPDKKMVPSGRANPQGIPYLYLSKDIETVLYEVRSAFLDEISVGTFQLKNDSNIILVDFTETGSAFSKIDEIIEFTKAMLLKRHISIELSKPIRRYDSEIEYIPTQFICEYIRYVSNADGILFNSSLHNGGKNIVLFSQDKIECMKVDIYRISKVDIEAFPLIN